MSNRRWSKFWWQDYERDPALRMCGLAAQGLWMRLLCIMHEGDPYGHLRINGKAPSTKQIGKIVGAPERDVDKLLIELKESGVCSIGDDGILFSRRMVRDKIASEEGAANGKSGGNPALKKGKTPTDKGGDDGKDKGGGNGGGLTPPFKLQETEAEAEKKEPFASLMAPAEPTPNSTEVALTILPPALPPKPPQGVMFTTRPEPRSAKDILFQEGLPIMVHLTGKSDKASRTQIGRWLSDLQDDHPRLMQILQDAYQTRPSDPMPWLCRAVNNAVQNRFRVTSSAGAGGGMGKWGASFMVQSDDPPAHNGPELDLMMEEFNQ